MSEININYSTMALRIMFCNLYRGSNYTHMKRVVLIFPDCLSIADFLLTEKVRNAEVDSHEQTVTGVLTDADIETAIKNYGAVIHPSL